MKIEAKVAKSAKSKRKARIVGVLKKFKGKYFYSRQIFKSFRKKLTKKKQARTNISQFHPFSESFLLKVRGLRFENPFMIKKCTVPKIVMPKVVHVAVHQGETISYQNDVLYHRIQTDELQKEMQSLKDDKELKLNYSIPQMQLQPEQYEIPSLVSKCFNKLHKVNLWMYYGKRISDWHYDGHDNFLYVLDGLKCVYLTHPTHIKAKSFCSLFNNHCEKKVDETNLPMMKALITNGDALFIPKGWWHKVISTGRPSKAVNYWGNSISSMIENMSQVQKSLVLKTLLFDLTDNCCKKFISQWQTLDETIKQEYRTKVGVQFPHLL